MSLLALVASAAALAGGGDLTRAQAAGQRFVFPFAGTQPPAELVRRIRRGEAAGVILFARNVRSVAQVRALTRRLQAIPRPAAVDAPLLVMVDQEGGPVRRLPGGPAAAAGRQGSVAAARRAGRQAARVLRAAGVNVDLAPVVDVARPGSAMQREGRAYRSAPGARGQAFAAELERRCVIAAPKHFPGFGAARVNTDDAPARIDLPLGTLRRVDLAPYRRIRPRLALVSTAVYPRVDPRPAAFSARWVREARAAGSPVLVTDDLQTPAVRSFGTPAQLAWFAMRAGVEMPLFAQDYATAARAATGVARSPLGGRALRAGAARVLALRRSLDAKAGC